MRCDHCDNYVTLDMRICPNCGFTVNASAASQIVGQYRDAQGRSKSYPLPAHKPKGKKIPPPSNPNPPATTRLPSKPRSTKPKKPSSPQQLSILSPVPGQRKQLDPIGRPENVESIVIAVKPISHLSTSESKGNSQIVVQIRRYGSSFVSQMTSESFFYSANMPPSEKALQEYKRLRAWVSSSGLDSKIILDEFSRIHSVPEETRTINTKRGTLSRNHDSYASIELIDMGENIAFALIEKENGKKTNQLKKSKILPRIALIQKQQRCVDAVNALRLYAAELGYQYDRVPLGRSWYQYAFRRSSSSRRKLRSQ